MAPVLREVIIGLLILQVSQFINGQGDPVLICDHVEAMMAAPVCQAALQDTLAAYSSRTVQRIAALSCCTRFALNHCLTAAFRTGNCTGTEESMKAAVSNIHYLASTIVRRVNEDDCPTYEVMGSRNGLCQGMFGFFNAAIRRINYHEAYPNIEDMSLPEIEAVLSQLPRRSVFSWLEDYEPEDLINELKRVREESQPDSDVNDGSYDDVPKSDRGARCLNISSFDEAWEVAMQHYNELIANSTRNFLMSFNETVPDVPEFNFTKSSIDFIEAWNKSVESSNEFFANATRDFANWRDNLKSAEEAFLAANNISTLEERMSNMMIDLNNTFSNISESFKNFQFPNITNFLINSSDDNPLDIFANFTTFPQLNLTNPAIDFRSALNNSLEDILGNVSNTLSSRNGVFPVTNFSNEGIPGFNVSTFDVAVESRNTSSNLDERLANTSSRLNGSRSFHEDLNIDDGDEFEELSNETEVEDGRRNGSRSLESLVDSISNFTGNTSSNLDERLGNTSSRLNGSRSFHEDLNIDVGDELEELSNGTEVEDGRRNGSRSLESLLDSISNFTGNTSSNLDERLANTSSRLNGSRTFHEDLNIDVGDEFEELNNDTEVEDGRRNGSRSLESLLDSISNFTGNTSSNLDERLANTSSRLNGSRTFHEDLNIDVGDEFEELSNDTEVEDGRRNGSRSLESVLHSIGNFTGRARDGVESAFKDVANRTKELLGRLDNATLIDRLEARDDFRGFVNKTKAILEDVRAAFRHEENATDRDARCLFNTSIFGEGWDDFLRHVDTMNLSLTSRSDEDGLNDTLTTNNTRLNAARRLHQLDGDDVDPERMSCEEMRERFNFLLSFYEDHLTSIDLGEDVNLSEEPRDDRALSNTTLDEIDAPDASVNESSGIASSRHSTSFLDSNSNSSDSNDRLEELLNATGGFLARIDEAIPNRDARQLSNETWSEIITNLNESLSKHSPTFADMNISNDDVLLEILNNRTMKRFDGEDNNNASGIFLAEVNGLLTEINDSLSERGARQLKNETWSEFISNLNESLSEYYPFFSNLELANDDVLLDLLKNRTSRKMEDDGYDSEDGDEDDDGDEFLTEEEVLGLGTRNDDDEFLTEDEVLGTKNETICADMEDRLKDFLTNTTNTTTGEQLESRDDEFDSEGATQKPGNFRLDGFKPFAFREEINGTLNDTLVNEGSNGTLGEFVDILVQDPFDSNATAPTIPVLEVDEDNLTSFAVSQNDTQFFQDTSNSTNVTISENDVFIDFDNTLNNSSNLTTFFKVASNNSNVTEFEALDTSLNLTNFFETTSNISNVTQLDTSLNLSNSTFLEFEIQPSTSNFTNFLDTTSNTSNITEFEDILVAFNTSSLNDSEDGGIVKKGRALSLWDLPSSPDVDSNSTFIHNRSDSNLARSLNISAEDNVPDLFEVLCELADKGYNTTKDISDLRSNSSRDAFDRSFMVEIGDEELNGTFAEIQNATDTESGRDARQFFPGRFFPPNPFKVLRDTARAASTTTTTTTTTTTEKPQTTQPPTTTGEPTTVVSWTDENFNPKESDLLNVIRILKSPSSSSETVHNLVLIVSSLIFLLILVEKFM